VALGEGYGELTDPQYHVVALDYGIKRNILRLLAGCGCKVTVLRRPLPPRTFSRSSRTAFFSPTAPAIRRRPAKYAVR